MNKFKLLLVMPALLFCTVADAAITTTVLANDARECVTYARSRVPKLPYGLTTLAQKKAIINSYSCSAGSVAIIDGVAYYGHVAVVEGCFTSQTSGAIRITETNWQKGKRTERRASNTSITKAAQELKILGYFKP